MFIFTKEGVFYHIEDAHSIGPTPPSGTRLGTGFERGLYTFDGAGLHFTTLVDTNGDVGTSGSDFFTFPTTVNGDIITFDPGDGSSPGHMYRVVSSPGGPPIGGWLVGDPTERNRSFAAVLTASGKFFQANDHVEFGFDDADPGRPLHRAEVLGRGLHLLGGHRLGDGYHLVRVRLAQRSRDQGHRADRVSASAC